MFQNIDPYESEINGSLALNVALTESQLNSAQKLINSLELEECITISNDDFSALEFNYSGQRNGFTQGNFAFAEKIAYLNEEFLREGLAFTGEVRLFGYMTNMFLEVRDNKVLASQSRQDIPALNQSGVVVEVTRRIANNLK